MRKRFFDALERFVRWYGRRKIAWRLYIHAVQDARYDDEDLPSNQEIDARAHSIERQMHHHFIASPPSDKKPGE